LPVEPCGSDGNTGGTGDGGGYELELDDDVMDDTDEYPDDGDFWLYDGDGELLPELDTDSADEVEGEDIADDR
jgi:hypothetical protein